MKVSEYTARRKAQNELFFRSINERIDKTGNIILNDSQKYITPIDFVCECSKVTCYDKIPLSLKEYEEIRIKRKSFIITPGHEMDEIEDVTREDDKFSLVQKTGKAAEEIDKVIN